MNEDTTTTIYSRDGELLLVVPASNLRYADLREANLRYADLQGADLQGADLQGAHLRSTDVCDAGCDPRGYRFIGVKMKQGSGWLEVAGCRGFTLADARHHWQSRHMNDPTLQALCLAFVDVLEAEATRRGWQS